MASLGTSAIFGVTLFRGEKRTAFSLNYLSLPELLSLSSQFLKRRGETSFSRRVTINYATDESLQIALDRTLMSHLHSELQ
ncbi:hypothetical protein TNCV_683111 [Trichonephila clavipes]|nr:hypothetical protein TNCV_683111 [Trichonephila clavipes]